MKRFLLNLNAAVSTVLLIAVVVLWVRGYSHTDYIAMENVFDRADSTPDSPGICWHTWAIVSESGRMGWAGRLYDRSAVSEWPENGMHFWFGGTCPPCPFSFSREGRGGFYLNHFRHAYNPDDPGVDISWRATVPTWLICVALVIVQAVKLRMLLRPSRNIGQCRACGYDLRATPEQCPECGTLVKTPDLKSPL